LVFQVSKFVLKRQLGQGAGGRVFLGRHVSDRNKRAAIKIIHKRSSNAKAVRMVTLLSSFFVATRVFFFFFDSSSARHEESTPSLLNCLHISISSSCSMWLRTPDGCAW